MNKNKSICIVIPARHNSTRLEAKALIDLNGKSMLERVYLQSKKSVLTNEVIVATDHDKIYNHCMDKGINVMMTSINHNSGTERICEVAHKKNHDYYINVQGDEPLVNPSQIDDLIEYIITNPNVEIATQCSTIKNSSNLLDFNLVKLVKSISNKVLYFSRQAIPAQKNKPFKEWINNHKYFKHHGIYAYSRLALQKIEKLPVSTLDKVESLEQLKWLEHDMEIIGLETIYDSIGVDTEEDAKRVRILLSEISDQ